MALSKKVCGWKKIFHFQNALLDFPVQELDRATPLRWPIEQCFEECRSNLGMGHYEGRSYQGWHHHMLFVMTAHLFTTQVQDILKKSIPSTMPMAVKLIHEIAQNAAVNLKAIVCYHIHRNHYAYLSHRKTVFLKSSL